ncbi:C25 family cysteine peptidase [Maridesulfovibrio sp. FT414]|uniref:C25 family cysteine peptidase n=1 Tax=Maridesulfovibrio sp. FT414 TaxID=2979469 RepID=UPI003D805B4C
MKFYQKPEAGGFKPMCLERKIILPIVAALLLCILPGCKVGGMGKVSSEAVSAVPARPEIKVSSAPLTDKRVSVIVCPGSFMRAAKYFAYLHREYEGVNSVIVRTPSANGTAESDGRIMAGIRDRIGELNGDGEVLSVLLLGDSSIIPRAVFSIGNGTETYVSDFGYGGNSSSPENVLPVGRIPARDGDEAEAVAAKYDRWYEDRAFRPAWPVSFIGGDGFGSAELSDPELLFFNLQQEGMAGPEAIRYLGAAGGCEPRRLLQSLAEDDASVQWLALNASPAGLKVGNGTLPVSGIMALEYKPGLPVVLVPSAELRSANSTEPTPAEAMVLSPGAGLAVMTGSGDSGKITAELDEGRVTRVDSSGTPRLLMEFHKAYFSGKHRIGDAITEARTQFVENLGRDEDSSPLYRMVFYGDPVMSLPLPVRTESPAYTGLNPITKPVNRQGVAVFAVNSTISFAMEDGTIYPAVQLQVVDRNTGRVVSSLKVEEDDVFNFSADGEGRYLLYSRPLDGPLAWQFFDVRAEGAVKAPPAKAVAVAGKPSPKITAGLRPVRYAVQVSSNRKQASATKLRSRLSGQGYDAYVVEVAEAGNRKWYCVRFGQYDSWSAAVEASAEYERREQGDAKIVRCDGG